MNATRILSLPKVEVPDWANEEPLNLEILNASQARYRPRSRVNPTEAAAPKGLVPMMAMALSRLEERVGDIDEWVSQKLQWSTTELAEKLTSEQIDAVALAIDSMEKKSGFLIADMTGFGKGRIAASVARYAALSGRRVVFFTEKANLFSDFWRDVRDIGSEAVFGKPFLLNAGAKIVDTSSSEGRVIFAPLKKKSVDEVLDNGLPTETRLVLTTYSQFSRKGRKTEWLENIAGGAHFIMDEGHNQAGEESSTCKNMAWARQIASSVTYSTATAGRNIRNLFAYGSVFPWLISIGDVENMTPAQATSFAEASVVEAAARGSLVRREHDLSNMILTLIEDTQNLERNKRLADAVSPILSRMAMLGNRVFAETERRNAENKEMTAQMPPGQRKRASEFWYSHNFGAKLNAIIGQFLVALKVECTADKCVEDLLQGIKPVVVIESTMESLMRELNKDPEDVPDEAEDLEEEIPLPEDWDEEEYEEPVTKTPPSFGEALRIMAERMLRVSVRRGGPDGEKETMELDDPAMVEMRDEIVEMAKAFPALSLSPIDDIRDLVEKRGREAFERGDIARPWVTDEISARSMRVVEGRYEPMPPRDRNTSVARFNNGETDMIVLTNAASTGLSIHDAHHFKSHAKRRMYELRPPRNVVQRVQMWGRVFRRGQRTEPDFFIISTGLEKEAFDLSVQNRKVQALNASVTGNSKVGMVVAARDYEDATGNDIAYDLLMENPAIARKMGISLTLDRESGDKSLFWIGKLLRRLWLLDNEEARFMFTNLVNAYEERVKAGIVRDGRTGFLDGRWKAVNRFLLEKGDGSDNPFTGKDVYLTEISTSLWNDPVGWKELNWMFGEAQKGFQEKVSQAAIKLRAGRQKALESVLFRPWKSVEQALRAKEDNPVRRLDATIRELTWFCANIKPGVLGTLPGEDGEPETCAVVDIRIPDETGNLFSSREWALSYVVPGEQEIRVVTLDAVIQNPLFKAGTQGNCLELKDVFERQTPGRTVVRKKILDGSPLGALAAARRAGGGRRMIFMDEAGREREGVVLPKSLARRIMAVPGITTRADVVISVLNDGGRLVSNPLNPPDGIEIRPYKGHRAVMSCPSLKKFQHIYENRDLLDVIGKWGEYGQRLEIIMEQKDVERVIPILSNIGVMFSYDAQHRKAALKPFERVDDFNPGLSP